MAPGARPAFARLERFDRIGSTNDVVRDWLAAGEREICVAVAAEQTEGRGRSGRTWTAPPGAALLSSLGFRPTWIAANRTWRVPATIALAMADAAEEVAGLPIGAIRLKWPNDLVIEVAGPRALLIGEQTPAEASARLAAPVELRKLAGVLGETHGLGSDDPRLVVGIGINADWRAADFPPEIASGMTSLRAASARRPIDADTLLDAFLERVEVRIDALREGVFDIAGWAERQATTGRRVTLDAHADAVDALGVDASTGALVVGDATAADGERHVHAGEVTRVRLAGGV
jgi:BirA family biotin operon repressor/biotin-[acetyl-CoA-carboxylase] ligase